MTHSDAMEKLQGVFDDVFLEPVKLRDDLTAADVPEWDSLTHVTLVLAVEKAFSVRFRMGEVERAKTVGEFGDLIVQRITTQG